MDSAYDVLARIRATKAPQPAGERCEMCSEDIADEHQHVVNVEGRQLMCVCRGCYLLFTDGDAQLRYRSVPDRYLHFPDLALGRLEWEALQIPVGLAFFFRNSALDKTVGFYPGPAGATESELDLDAWSLITTADARVAMMADDVEALLVRVPDNSDRDADPGVLSGPDRRLLRVRRQVADAVARFRRRPAGACIHRRFLRPDHRALPGSQQGTRIMTAVTFAVLDVAPEPYAVSPQLTAQIAVVADDPVQAIALRCQVRIEPLRRPYSDDEAAGLADMFGPRERWANTQRTFLWQHTAAMVQGFTGSTQVALPLECTYDFEVTGSKYLHALREGTIPLQFLFSGTVFRPPLASGQRGFAVQQVPWDQEDQYDMPVSVWHDLIHQHYPNSGWVRLGHDTVTALTAYKSERGMLGHRRSGHLAVGGRAGRRLR